MKRVLLAVAALAVCAAPALAAPVNLSNFDAVRASGRLSIEITMGDRFAVDISGPRAERVEAHVRGGALVLSTHNGFFHFGGGEDAHVSITMPAVRAIESSAGVEVTAANIRAETLRLEASSGSELHVSGRCASLTVEASSGAELDARELRCASVRANASSGADAAIYASERADIDASSGADIRLSGEGQLGTLSLSSGGDLNRQTR